MNVFNRVLMSFLLLLFILFILMLSLLPKTLVEWLLSDSFHSMLVQAEQGMSPLVLLAGAILGLLVAGGAFLLLLAELRPPTRQSVVVAEVAGGTAELTNESIALRVRRVAEAIDGVKEALPTIHSHRKSVDVALRLITDPDIDLPRKTEEVMQAVRVETETRMGVPVSSLKVTVRHVPYEGRGSGSAPYEGRGSGPVPLVPPKPGLQG